MTQPQFWHLDSHESTSGHAEWAHDKMDLDQVICPAREGHRREGRRLTDLSVTLPGRKVQDIVWTWYSECLIQDRVLNLFRDNGLTGFEVKPVKSVFKKAREKPPRLWELVVTGWAGMAPPESGIRLVERCEGCGHTTYSEPSDVTKLISPSQWDGSDFFIVWPLPNFIFVTERVVHVIRDNDLKGVVLTPPAKLLFLGPRIKKLAAKRIRESNLPGAKPMSPEDVARLMDYTPRLAPGRLSYCMPEKRARELGEPLGIY